jgi:hypothetical protein
MRLVAAAAVLSALGLSSPAAAAARDAAARPAPGRAISPKALERSHGIRITQVAVTGAGGLVDLRFTVVDPQKARPLLEGHAGAPQLIAVKSGLALDPPHHGAMRSVRLKKDAASFILYPNARNAIRPGSRVAVAFGAVRVEPVVAR